jgi:hypothetical protein
MVPVVVAKVVYTVVLEVVTGGVQAGDSEEGGGLVSALALEVVPVSAVAPLSLRDPAALATQKL